MLGEAGIGVAGGDVAWAGSGYLVFDLNASAALVGSEHFEYRVASASAEVDGAAFAFAGLAGGGVGNLLEVDEGAEVTDREVLDVDVVADAAAVRGGVVAAEDLYLLELAAGDLADDGHEVVGDAFGVFANSAAGMRADGVEVTQDADAPTWLRARQVKEHLLDHGFAVAVGIGGLDAFLLGDGYALGVAVDCGRGAEYQGLAAMLLHTLQEADCGIEVVIVITQRLGDGFTYGFEAGEVDDSVEAASGE